jgi:hypothetical protein
MAAGEAMSQQTEFSKKKVLAVLRKVGISAETVKEIDECLEDPIKLPRDGTFLLRHGITRDQLVNMMGGSP